jgi:MFS transporter, AAHS family, 4-hydroxybenzoate transporter
MPRETMSPNTESPTTVDVSAIIEGQGLSLFLVSLVVISWIITFFDGYDMNVIGFAAPYFAKELDLTRVMLGNVFSIGTFGLLVGGFLFGYLGDAVGRRPAIILTTLLFGFFTLLMAFATSYASLLGLRFCVGVAAGGMLPLAWALNLEYAPKRYRATVVTLIMIGYSLGVALGGPISNWLAPRYGWQAIFVFGGALSLLSGGALFFLLPESIRFLASRGRDADVIVRTLQHVAPTVAIPRDATFVVADEEGHSKSFSPALLFIGDLAWITPLLWIAYIFSSMAAFFLASWTPLVFEALHFTRSDAAWAGTLVSAAGALGGIALMRFTDTKGAIAITIMPLLAIPLLIATGFSDFGYAGIFVAIALIGFTVFGGHYGMHTLAGLYYPSAYRANGTGWATSVAKIGSIVGPWIGGVILSTSLPARNIFAILALCPAVVMICVFFIGRVHSRILRAERSRGGQATA